MKGRVKPEPALCGEISLHDHIGDQETIHEDGALDVQPQHRPNRAARPIADDQPVHLR